MAIFIPYAISTRDTHIIQRAKGGYGVHVWYENYHTIIYLSYIFLSDDFDSEFISSSQWVCLLTTASFFCPVLCEIAEIVTMFLLVPTTSFRFDKMAADD